METLEIVQVVLFSIGLVCMIGALIFMILTVIDCSEPHGKKKKAKKDLEKVTEKFIDQELDKKTTSISVVSPTQELQDKVEFLLLQSDCKPVIISANKRLGRENFYVKYLYDNKIVTAQIPDAYYLTSKAEIIKNTYNQIIVKVTEIYICAELGKKYFVVDKQTNNVVEVPAVVDKGE